MGGGNDFQCKIEEVVASPRNHTTSIIMKKLRGCLRVMYVIVLDV